jgi:hypothetical protein
VQSSFAAVYSGVPYPNDVDNVGLAILGHFWIQNRCVTPGLLVSQSILTCDLIPKHSFSFSIMIVVMAASPSFSIMIVVMAAKPWDSHRWHGAASFWSRSISSKENR